MNISLFKPAQGLEIYLLAFENILDERAAKDQGQLVSLEVNLKKIKHKKSEQYWGQRQNGWAGAVIVGRGGNARR